MAVINNLEEWARIVAAGGRQAERLWDSFLGSVTAGTVTASKAIVAGASKDVDTLDITTLKIAGTPIGASGATLNTGYIPLDITSLREAISNDVGVAATAAARGSGSILASDTTPTLARVNGATDKALRVTWATSNVDEVMFPPVPMPPGLDGETDVTVHLLAAMAGATDTPTIDVQVFDGVGDTEMGGATAALSDTLAEITVTIAAANLTGHPLGFLNIALVPGAHGTDALYLYGAWLEYTKA